MSLTREEASKRLDGAMREFSPPPQSSGFTRRSKTVQSISAKTHAPTKVPTAAELVEEMKRSTEAEIEAKVKSLTQIIDTLRKIDVLKTPPSPLNLEIPPNVDSENIDKYATEYTHYMESFDDLKDLPFLTDDRNETISHMMAFLINTRKMKKNYSGNPEKYFEYCSSQTDQTLLLLREKAKDQGISLIAFLNSYPF